MTDLSVIIPAYNCASTIHESISSIFQQTLKPKQLIIINDGSTDTTRDVIEASIHHAPSDINMITLHRENRGIAQTLQELIERARYDVVARMDADDISTPDRLAIQYEAITRGLNIVGSNIKLFGDRSGKVIYPEHQSDIDYSILFRCPFCHPAIMAQKSYLNYKNEKIEDYKLWLRLWAENKVKWANIQSFLLNYRVSSYQMSSQDRLNISFDPKNYTSQFRKIRKTHITKNGLQFTIKHRLRKMINKNG